MHGRHPLCTAQFLVYEIDLGTLMLDSVALDFVLSMDELIFASLAPARAKRLLRELSGFKLKPRKTWSGLDGRTLMMLLLVCAAMVWATLQYVTEQLDTLRRVQAAICYGDTQFVYALDAQVMKSLRTPQNHCSLPFTRERGSAR